MQIKQRIRLSFSLGLSVLLLSLLLSLCSPDVVEAGKISGWLSRFIGKRQSKSRAVPPLHVYSAIAVPSGKVADRLASYLDQRSQGQRISGTCLFPDLPVACISGTTATAVDAPILEAAAAALDETWHERQRAGWGPLFSQAEDLFVQQTSASPLLSVSHPAPVCSRDSSYTWGVIDEAEGSVARVKVVSKIVEAPPAVEEGEETPRHLVLPPLPVQNWTNASVPIEKGLIVAVVCLAREEAPVILLHKQHVVRPLPEGEWLVPVTLIEPQVVWTSPEGPAEVRTSILLHADWIPVLQKTIEGRQAAQLQGNNARPLVSLHEVDVLADAAEAAAGDFTIPLTAALHRPEGWEPSKAYILFASIKGTENIAKGNNLLPAVLADSSLRRDVCLLSRNTVGALELRCPELERLMKVKGNILTALRQAEVPTGEKRLKKAGQYALATLLLRFIASFQVLASVLTLCGTVTLVLALYNLIAALFSGSARKKSLGKLSRQLQKLIVSSTREAAKSISSRSPQRSYVNVYLLTSDSGTSS